MTKATATKLTTFSDNGGNDDTTPMITEKFEDGKCYCDGDGTYEWLWEWS